MINHAVESVNYLTAATIDTHGDDDRKVAITQVHATLEIAKQKRVANLISYAEAIHKSQISTPDDRANTRSVLQVLIAEELGL